jgi:thymidylate kinase
MYILEGPDGAGKSNLALQLQNTTGHAIVRLRQPTEDELLGKVMFNDYKKLIKQYRNAIFDRSWYSEMVYGPVMRKGSVITYPDMFELERTIATSGGGIIIHCTAAPAKLWKRCKAKREDYITTEELLKQIVDDYEQLMGTPHILPVVRYEYKDVY